MLLIFRGVAAVSLLLGAMLSALCFLRWWALFPIALFFFTLFFIPMYAFGRDIGQWENNDPAVRAWYQSLMQPDNPAVPCCGEADAYWADEIRVRDGKTFAVVTDDRDDAPLRRPHIAVGTEFFVPDYKLKYDKGNPTGHAILFVGYGGTYCYVQGGGV